MHAPLQLQAEQLQAEEMSIESALVWLASALAGVVVVAALTILLKGQDTPFIVLEFPMVP